MYSEKYMSRKKTEELTERIKGLELVVAEMTNNISKLLHRVKGAEETIAIMEKRLSAARNRDKKQHVEITPRY